MKLREVGDANFNLDVVLADNNVPIGRVRRNPQNGTILNVGLHTGNAAEIKCFSLEAGQCGLFDFWDGNVLDDAPNPFLTK